MSFFLNLNYKDLYDASPCGYFCATLQGDIIEVNQRFIAFTGLSQNEIIGKKHLSDFLTGGGRIYLESHFFPLLLVQGEVQEINFVNNKQERFPVLINATIVKDSDGNATYIQATVFNISQRKSYEKELLLAKQRADDLSDQVAASNETLRNNEALILQQKLDVETLNQRLTSKNSQLSDFAYIISHNLRAPVFNLQGLLGLYLDEKEWSQRNEIFNLIQQVTNEMDSTLNELIDALKVQADFYESKMKLSFESVLAKVKLMVAAEINVSKAIITSDFSEAKEITYSKVYLESAMLNLLSNAMKYSAPNRVPKIHVTTENYDAHILVHVSDNGLGIDLTKYGQHLFKLNKTFHNHPQAKGIGLYMTKVQLEALGGTIAVESAVNIGSRFTMKLMKNV